MELHRETSPPFTQEEIATEHNMTRRRWMILQNEEWAASMEEERRRVYLQGEGY